MTKDVDYQEWLSDWERRVADGELTENVASLPTAKTNPDYWQD